MINKIRHYDYKYNQIAVNGFDRCDFSATTMSADTTYQFALPQDLRFQIS